MHVRIYEIIIKSSASTCWEGGGHAIDSRLALLGQGLLSNGLHRQLQVIQKLSILTHMRDRTANV